MRVGKTGGGVGTNQYAVRGRAKALPTGTVDTPPVSMALVSDLGTDRRRCGEVWGTKCQAWVTPPTYTHGKHPTKVARERYTRRADADPRVLEGLSADKDPLIRGWVAMNPNTSPEALDTLAQDENRWVRRGVAGNPNASSEMLDDLARDEDPQVRSGVAENHHTDPKRLEELARDEDGLVRGWVARNPNASIEMLDTLAQDEDRWVRSGVAGNPRTSSKALKYLVNDDDYEVATLALANPNLPDAVKTVYHSKSLDTAHQRQYLSPS